MILPTCLHYHMWCVVALQHCTTLNPLFNFGVTQYLQVNVGNWR